MLSGSWFWILKVQKEGAALSFQLPSYFKTCFFLFLVIYCTIFISNFVRTFVPQILAFIEFELNVTPSKKSLKKKKLLTFLFMMWRVPVGHGHPRFIHPFTTCRVFLYLFQWFKMVSHLIIICIVIQVFHLHWLKRFENITTRPIT